MSNVITLRDTGKQAIEQAADSLSVAIEEGLVDPLELHVTIKAYEKVFDKVKGQLSSKAYDEALKHGGKSFDFKGAKVQVADFMGATYDYSVCNDPILVRLTEANDATKKALSDRQEMLKALKAPIEILDSETGEVCTVLPPLKKGSSGVKIGW
jgi:hypothetical protein